MIIRNSSTDIHMQTVCELCGKRDVLNECICQECLIDLPLMDLSCVSCGRELLHRDERCGKCLASPFLAQRVLTAFKYQYPLDVLVKLFKYKQQTRLIYPLARILAHRIRAASNAELPVVLIPVPLHHKRLYQRGFNQSQQICSALSGILGVGVDNGLVSRTRNTLPMVELEIDQRRTNIAGAFRWKKACDYKSVAIVDDVITSGSTMNEVAMLFRNAGVKHIEFWALARAE